MSGPPEFVILTGMSGAGRSTAADVLEDRGWYVVDNLPPSMLVQLGELVSTDPEPARLAAVVDVRARDFVPELERAMTDMQERGWRPRTVFVDASDEALVRRFDAVRRPHPLQGEGLMLDGIRRERRMLGEIRAAADVIIDTTGFNVHQLTAKIDDLLNAGAATRLRVAVLSFGFKYGIPLDADIVLDLRFLPNPYWDPAMRPLTGRDPEVRDFVLGQPGATDFIGHAARMLKVAIEGYLVEGRRFVTVGMGCTGGKHRSVAAVEALVAALGETEGVTVSTFHRDLGRE